MADRFFVHGRPRGKARPRFANGHTYTPRATINYEREIATSYIAHGGGVHEGQCTVKITAYFSIPKSWPKYRKLEVISEAIMPQTKPDIDNIIKVVLDGLNGVAYYDDKQVVRVAAEKRYSRDTEGLDIQVYGHDQG